MVLTRYEHAPRLRPFGVDLGRLFDDWFSMPATESGGAPDAWRPFPAVNAWRDEGGVVVEVAAPGVPADEIEVSLEGRDLTIRFERTEPEPEGGAWLVRERPSGRFRRTLRLPFDAAGDEIGASLEAGVLTVRVPESEAARPRRIGVTTE